MREPIGSSPPHDSDALPNGSDPGPSLLCLEADFSSERGERSPAVFTGEAGSPAPLFWLDRVQGPISVPWWRQVAPLPPSAHQVAAALWLCRNLYRDGRPIRWSRDRQRLLGTPLQSAHDGLGHLRRAQLVRVIDRGPGRLFDVEITNPAPDPVLDRTRWPKNEWGAIRGPISRPWLAMAARATGARSQSDGAYSRPGATILVGLALWAVRNRGNAAGNVVPAGITTITMFGTKHDAARRALRALVRTGLVKPVDRNFVEIVSPDPDPVLDGQELWREFVMKKYGLVAWPTPWRGPGTGTRQGSGVPLVHAEHVVVAGIAEVGHVSE